MADAPHPEPLTSDAPDPPISAQKRKRLFSLLGLAVLIAALAWGAWYLITQRGRIETDNAYVGADTAAVTALVPGAVLEVRVAGTQTVRRGDVLVVIDAADARIDVATAEAALLQARQRYGQTSAEVGAARARLSSRGADIAQAQARVSQAQAALERARSELARRQSLAGSGAVSGEELTSARAAFADAQAAVTLARAGVDAARATSAAAASDVTANEALVRGTSIDTAPDVAAARARLDAARLALARTIVRAPIGGVITNRTVQVGQRIAAGATIMTIVPTDSAYVDANFKETQFRRLAIGQPAELTADFYGDDVVYRGRVVGYAGGTGAAFSVIPAQNATGNWVKVVQRLPVRIAIDPADLRAHPLRVGLSMTATIDTRGR